MIIKLLRILILIMLIIIKYLSINENNRKVFLLLNVLFFNFLIIFKLFLKLILFWIVFMIIFLYSIKVL